MARILVVDDDPDVGDACELILQKEGHEVLWVPSRERGLMEVESFKPELVILDVMMDEPDDGIQMAQELKRRDFSSPVLMMTSIGKVTGIDYDKDSEMVPVDEFVEKPVDPKSLVEKINKLLNS